MGSSLPPSRGDPNAVAAPTGPATEAAAPERAESPARRSSGPSSLQDRRTAGGLPGKETGWGFFSCGNDVRLGRNDTDFAGRMRLFYVWDPRSSANILSKILNSQNGYIPGRREYYILCSKSHSHTHSSTYASAHASQLFHFLNFRSLVYPLMHANLYRCMSTRPAGSN
jgi:hypothetical protein